MIVLTAEDDEVLRGEAGIPRRFRIPNIVQLRDRPILERGPDVVFVGSFCHRPNVDAITWFVEDVWGLVRRRMPCASLKIIGDEATTEVRDLARRDGVELLGHVPELEPYLDRTAISIAPLRYGAGMKGKVSTALASGVPMVTTSVGAQGFRARVGQAPDRGRFRRGLFGCGSPVACRPGDGRSDGQEGPGPHRGHLRRNRRGPKSGGDAPRPLRRPSASGDLHELAGLFERPPPQGGDPEHRTSYGAIGSSSPVALVLVGAGDRQGMLAPVSGVFVSGAVRVAHDVGRHGRAFAVVRDASDDRQPGAAVGAVEEGMAIAAVPWVGVGPAVTLVANSIFPPYRVRGRRRFARDEQVLEEDQEADGRIDAVASVLRRQIGTEELDESQAFEDAIEDREDADAIGEEVVVARLGVMSDLDDGLGIIGVSHRCGSSRQCGGHVGISSHAWPVGWLTERVPRLPPTSLSGGRGRQEGKQMENSYVTIL